MLAFVAGATGYVGSSVVRLLAQRDDVQVVAHIRPDSSRLKERREEFEALGATVDTSLWQEEAMAQTFAKLEPDHLYCCIGTTRARKKASDNPDDETYDAVDYGLTALLVRACVEAEVQPRFVYISAAGAGPGASTAYMRARWKAEGYLRHSDLPYTIARPSFITGPDREESRPGERVGAALADVGLTVAGLVGFVGLRDRYKSMTADELADALVKLAFDDDAEDEIYDARVLRQLADE